jgi:hypothetical protein
LNPSLLCGCILTFLNIMSIWGTNKFNIAVKYKVISIRCGYEVPGMILLNAYLCTYSILRGVSFEVLPLRGYTLRSTKLPLLKTFLELLLWYSFQCCYHIFFMSSVSRNLHLFKTDSIFGNSKKSFQAKSGE